MSPHLYLFIQFCSKDLSYICFLGVGGSNTPLPPGDPPNYLQSNHQFDYSTLTNCARHTHSQQAWVTHLLFQLVLFTKTCHRHRWQQMPIPPCRHHNNICDVTINNTDVWHENNIPSNMKVSWWNRSPIETAGRDSHHHNIINSFLIFCHSQSQLYLNYMIYFESAI